MFLLMLLFQFFIVFDVVVVDVFVVFDVVVVDVVVFYDILIAVSSLLKKI